MASVMDRAHVTSSCSEIPPINTNFSRELPTYAVYEPRRPIAHMEFQGARHLIPERLPSARRERTVGFRVIDFTADVVGNINALAPSLRRLDLSNLDLEQVEPSLLDGLVNLERIVCNNNRLTENSFPDNFSQLEKLVEISAHDNCLTQLPKVFRKIKGITRLKISDNQLTMLDGVEKLKKLVLLVLDGNSLDNLPKELFHNLKRLEYLHCSGNCLTGLPSDVRNMRYLKDLNLSHNNLTSLPAEVFVLPRLEILNASCNQINRIPTLNVKGNLKRKFTSIDLSDNQLVRFPSHLMFMTNKLDLSQNTIKTIPLSLIDKLDQVPELKLVLRDNPMMLPPQDICDCGLYSIIQYFMEIKTDMRIYQGIKLLVLGAEDQGKTSLVQSLVDQQARLTEDERTFGVDIYDHSIDLDRNDDPLSKHLNLSVWDFSGNQRYTFQHQYFLQPHSLVLMVFDLSQYNPSRFTECFGQWIDWILCRTNRIVAIPVGTHADKVKKKLAEICGLVSRQICEYIVNIRESIEREIKRIESKPYISPALSEQLKLYINLTKMETVIHDHVLPVSSRGYTGFMELEDIIVQHAQNTEMFPNVMREIPSLWGDVVNYVDDQGYAMQIPMLLWSDYVTLVSGKFGMRHLMTPITEYLHDTGKVIWFYDHPTLRDYVFLRPTWLTDVLKSLFRHDLQELDYTMEESFRQHNVSLGKLDRMKREVEDEATFDRDLARCLWSNIFQTDMNRPLLEVLATLIEHFQIGYALNVKPSRRMSVASNASNMSRASTLDREQMETLTLTPRKGGRRSSITPSKDDRAETMSVATNKTKATDKSDKSAESDQKPVPKISKVILPWLRDPKPPLKFKDDYQKFTSSPHITAVIRFPKFIPPGLFETFTIRAQNHDYELQTLYHWKNGLYSRHQQTSVRFFLQRIDHDDQSTCVRMELTHEQPPPDEDVQDTETEQMWQVLLPVIKDFETVIAKYKGARMERYMECPHCKSTSFLGEWFTPKETQGLDCKPCDTCKKDVLSTFLVQPKDKKRVEEYLLQKLLEEAEKRRQVAARLAAGSEDQPAAAETKQQDAADIAHGASSPSSTQSQDSGSTPSESKRKKSSERTPEKRKLEKKIEKNSQRKSASQDPKQRVNSGKTTPQDRTLKTLRE